MSADLLNFMPRAEADKIRSVAAAAKVSTQAVIAGIQIADALRGLTKEQRTEALGIVLATELRVKPR